ncbi:Splicing factor-like protein, partial [Parasponia andersonii]
IEPILSGNLPPGFDSSQCRSVYVGNIHPQVTETDLQQLFSAAGPLEGCKLIRKDKVRLSREFDDKFSSCLDFLGCTSSRVYAIILSSYGFVDYFDRRSAAFAIITLNGRHLYGQPIKVNWAYASSQREDTSGHFNIFVGDLSPEVTDATLFACFSVYTSCSDAKVMWDQKTGRSRGFGFVAFRNQQDAQSAINDLNGKWLGSRQIRCNWATKGSTTNEDKQITDSKSVVELTSGTSEDGQEKASEDAPENNPQYTTVYVGNLAPEVTSVDVHRHFHALGAGTIEDVRVQRDKGFGFVRFSTHAEAALAIQLGNARMLFGKTIKCSWGSKPTPPGTNSSPLPPPAAVSMPSFSAADLAAYERQVALSKMGGAQALLHPPGQHALKAAMGMGAAGGSQAIFDGGYPNVATTQQLMYYQ